MRPPPRRRPELEALESRDLPSTAFAFDFGTPTSPVAPGYTQVTATTHYRAARGYGWEGGKVTARDRGSGSALTRDFNATADATFAVKLPRGLYAVTLTMGDAT